MARQSNVFLLWLAGRYLLSRKGKSLSFMTTVSILGVAIGVAALVVVLSVMGGFERDLRKRMFFGLPHLEILHENTFAGFSLKEHSLEDFKTVYPEAKNIEPFTRSDVVIKQKKNLSSATLFGIDPDLGGNLWGFFSKRFDVSFSELKEDQLKNMAPDIMGGVILGESLAIQLDAAYGDDVSVLSPHANVGDVLSGGQISAKFKVIGTFQTDSPQFDSKYAIVSLKSGRHFLPDYDPSLETDRYVSGVALSFHDAEAVEHFKNRVSKWPNLKGTSWKDTNKSLIFALKLEKFTMGTILFLIVVVAAFSISGTIMMTVYNRRSQIGLFRSLGMYESEMMKVYLFIGFFIGTVGALLGLLIGLGACTLLYSLQFVELPFGVYYQNRLPVRFLPLEYLVITIGSCLLSMIAAFYPSRVAAKQDPGSCLRYL